MVQLYNAVRIGYVMQCLHDVMTLGVMDIWWCKNCTKSTQNIVWSAIKETISLTPTPTSTWSYIYKALFVVLYNSAVPWHHIFMTLLHHIHIHNIFITSCSCQQIFVTILQHIAIASYIHDASVTSYSIHIIYPSHLVSVATSAHHTLRHDISAYIHYTIYQ